MKITTKRSRRVEWNVDMMKTPSIIYRLLLLLLLFNVATTSVGQNLPDVFDDSFESSLEFFEKTYPQKISYYTHPKFPHYQFRKIDGNNYSTVENIYAVWNNGKLIKVIPGKSFWDYNTHLRRRGPSFSEIYYASLIENNVLNIKAEKKLFVDEVKMQLGVIPRPKNKIEMYGGYSPQLMQILISKCKSDLVRLERMYASKRISKKDYIEKKRNLNETLAEAKRPRLTSAEEERVRGFIYQLQNDYPLNGPDKTVRIDSLSFANIVFKDDTDRQTPLVAFKLTFLQEPDYQVVYKITLIPPTEYNKIDTLIIEEEKAEVNAEEVTKVFELAEEMPSFPGGNRAMMEYISHNLRYPFSAQENGVQGRVVVSFVVERDGSITNAEIARGIDPSLDEEAIRLVESMPKWNPGKQNGSTVPVRYSVPVNFKVQ